MQYGDKAEVEPRSPLKAGYEYIARTVFQANENPARVSTFYFVSTGWLAAILGTRFAADNLRRVSIGFSLLFPALGALTLAQRARLRAGWHESIEAVNQWKVFYLDSRPEIEPGADDPADGQALQPCEPDRGGSGRARLFDKRLGHMFPAYAPRR